MGKGYRHRYLNRHLYRCLAAGRHLHCRCLDCPKSFPSRSLKMTNYWMNCWMNYSSNYSRYRNPGCSRVLLSR